MQYLRRPGRCATFGTTGGVQWVLSNGFVLPSTNAVDSTAINIPTTASSPCIAACTSDFSPVCDNERRFYQNDCYFRIAACFRRQQPRLARLFRQQCPASVSGPQPTNQAVIAFNPAVQPLSAPPLALQGSPDGSALSVPLPSLPNNQSFILPNQDSCC